MVNAVLLSGDIINPPPSWELPYAYELERFANEPLYIVPRIAPALFLTFAVILDIAPTTEIA